MKILGIETSCDETAAAVVELLPGDNGCSLLSNVIASSVDLHAKYGGVVPEIAARSHIESIIPVVKKALVNASSSNQLTNKKLATGDWRLATQSDPWDQIDGITVTNGAGLGGSLLIGVMTARTLAIIKKKPLYAINHVEGHLYANFITKVAPSLSNIYRLPSTTPVFPMLGLIVSGGHTQLVFFKDHFDYRLLGQTRDDAIGEAFDKVAKMLGLPYPGGPSVAEAAKKGDPFAYNFPKARSIITQASHVDVVQGNGEQRTEPYTKYDEGAAQQLTPHGATSSSGATSSDGGQAVAMRGLGKYDFSFSGIKTAVLRTAQAEIGEDYAFPSQKLPGRLSDAVKANIAASFQRIAVETIVDKTVLAYQEFQPKSVIIGGGVAANRELRDQLAKRLPIAIEFQDSKLMGDNGAMIAALGCYKAKHKQPEADPYTLDIQSNLSM